jgi:hypothetical protein
MTESLHLLILLAWYLPHVNQRVPGQRIVESPADMQGTFGRGGIGVDLGVPISGWFET